VGKKGRLPSEYQEVEWIGSSGTQYIDSGILRQVETKIQLKICPQTNSTIDNTYIGVRDSSSGNGCLNLIGQYYSRFSFVHQGTTLINGGELIQYNRIYDIEGYFGSNNSYLKVDNVKIYDENVVKSYTGNRTYYLFARNSNGTVVFNSYIRLSYCKMFINDILARDFIPCYRKSDNEIGMYDLVNGVFYTNQGTGTFTKDADVN